MPATVIAFLDREPTMYRVNLAAVALTVGLMVSSAEAATFRFTFENAYIGSTQDFPITGSLTFNDDVSLLGNPFSDVDVTAVTPDGTFSMNLVWTASVGPTMYIGLSTGPELTDYAMNIFFSQYLNDASAALTPVSITGLSCQTIPATSQWPCEGSRYGTLLAVINGFPETRRKRIPSSPA